MIYIGIDPGTTESGVAEYDASTNECLYAGKIPNRELSLFLDGLLKIEEGREVRRLAIEEITSYGAPMSKYVLATVFWSGRFAEAWDKERELGGKLITRMKVKSVLIGSQGNDKSIRNAMERIFPQTGTDSKGKPTVFGTKKKPGPLYGVTKDAIQALAVAYTASVAWETLTPIPS